MPTIQSFEEIEAWTKAREFSSRVYKLTTSGSLAQDYSLRNQINASTGSIMDNIAEGYGRGGNKEFLTFLSYARGSADESRSQLYRALDRGHLSEEMFRKLKDDVVEIVRMITGFMRYLRASNIRGSKFLDPPESYE